MLREVGVWGGWREITLGRNPFGSRPCFFLCVTIPIFIILLGLPPRRFRPSQRGKKSVLGAMLIINELAKKLQKSAKIFGKTLAGFKKVATFASAFKK